MSTWIKVEDRLPAEKQTVFALSQQYHPDRPVVLRYEDGSWYDPDFDGYDEGPISSEVTDWMPIPTKQ